MIVFTSFPILIHWLRWSLLCRHDAVKVASLFGEKLFSFSPSCSRLASTRFDILVFSIVNFFPHSHPTLCNTITTDDDDVVTQSMPETLWNAETNIISMISILRSSSRTFAFAIIIVSFLHGLSCPQNRRSEWIDFCCYDFSTEYKCCQAFSTSHWSRNDAKSLDRVGRQHKNLTIWRISQNHNDLEEIACQWKFISKTT